MQLRDIRETTGRVTPGSGGGANSATFSQTIRKPGHGYSVGQVVHFADLAWAKPQFRKPDGVSGFPGEDCSGIGLITQIIDANTFVSTYGGVVNNISLPSVSTSISGSCWLSSITAGELVTTRNAVALKVLDIIGINLGGTYNVYINPRYTKSDLVAAVDFTADSPTVGYAYRLNGFSGPTLIDGGPNVSGPLEVPVDSGDTGVILEGPTPTGSYIVGIYGTFYLSSIVSEAAGLFTIDPATPGKLVFASFSGIFDLDTSKFIPVLYHLGSGIVTMHPQENTLSNLLDVNFLTGGSSNPTNNQVLTWSAVEAVWYAKDPSGVSGFSGFSGYSGFSGISGFSGKSGYSGISGFSGFSGISGWSGISGFSGFSGAIGLSGFSGISGWSGSNGTNGTNGTNGSNGLSGFSGATGSAGSAGADGASGYSGVSGFSGFSGFSGYSGYSGKSGYSGVSGYSGASLGGSFTSGQIIQASGSSSVISTPNIVVNSSSQVIITPQDSGGSPVTWQIANADNTSGSAKTLKLMAFTYCVAGVSTTYMIPAFQV